jgi:hypothetical protein
MWSLAGMAVANRTLDRFTSMKSNGLALLLYVRTEPTATALPDAELVPITAAWLNGFLDDKFCEHQNRSFSA